MSIFSLIIRSCFKPAARVRSLRRGFTLIELLVVVAIITILTGVLLFQQRKFDSSTLLRSLAYSVALSVRQAQVYGTSVREFGAGNFSSNYGIYLSSGSPNDYWLFADGGAKDSQRASDGSEDVQQFKISPGYSITSFCGILASNGTKICNLTYLTIYFKRPNPDAYFAANSGGPYSGAYIQLNGPGGATRSVTVTTTGQILVGAYGS